MTGGMNSADMAGDTMLQVQPHVDLALIAALTVVFDERCNEPKPVTA